MANPISACKVITALVTPFKADESLCIDSLQKLVKHCVENGTDAFVLAGTTGEGSALTEIECKTLLNEVKSLTTVPLILATGTHSTHTTIEKSKKALDAGADALLIVAPYYVKPSQEGIIAHFQAISQALPQSASISLYNIPGRTSVMMIPETIAEIAKTCPNIIGVKQSYPDMDAVSAIKALCPNDFLIWSGDDSLTLPMLSLGAVGIISVVSHVFGNEMQAMISAFEAGNNDEAFKYHQLIFKASKLIFNAPNPIGIKACLSQMKLIQPHLRLPLLSLSENDSRELYASILPFINEMRPEITLKS